MRQKRNSLPVATQDQVNGLAEADFNNFMRISSALSPENLSWDGERSPQEIKKAAASLRKEWAALEEKCGFRVNDFLLWNRVRGGCHTPSSGGV